MVSNRNKAAECPRGWTRKTGPAILYRSNNKPRDYTEWLHTVYHFSKSWLNRNRDAKPVIIGKEVLPTSGTAQHQMRSAVTCE